MNNGITTLQNLIGSLALITEKSSTKAKTDTAVVATAPSVDQASLSSVGNVVARAMANSSATSDVRFDKIAPLQSAIASGSYQVPASEVADKMMDFMMA